MKNDIDSKLHEGLFGERNTSVGFCINPKIVMAWGENLVYNSKECVYTTPFYTSAAGNRYYESVHFFDRLVICYDLGIGWAHKFINGIKLYRYNGTGVELISKSFYSCRYFDTPYDKELAQHDAVDMLKRFLEGQAKLLGIPVSKCIIPIS